MTEEAPLRPLSAYAESKVRAEEALSDLADGDFAPIFMRNATAYGASPRVRLDVVLNNLAAWAFTTGKVLIMSDGTPWRPLVHVRDISAAAAAALVAPIAAVGNEAFNVGGNDENYRVRDLAEIVRETFAGCEIEYAEGAGPDPRSYRVDFRKLAETLPDAKPTWTARDGARELLDAFRSARLTPAGFDTVHAALAPQVPCRRRSARRRPALVVHARARARGSVKVVLFCGGLGLRMQEAAPSIPKPMVPIANRPILLHIMKYYAHFGHDDFVICLGHKGEVIKEYFLNYNEALANDFVLSQGGTHVELLASDIGDWRITFVDTGLHNNVGQRLRAVRDHLRDEEVFLATYGDAVTDAPLPQMVANFHERDKIAAFLAVRPRSYSFHTVRLSDGELVRGIEDVTRADMWINGGFFIFRPEIFDHIQEDEELVEEPFERLIEQEELIAYPYDGFWAPMDTLKDKHNLETLAASGRPPWEVWMAPDGDRITASPRP